MMEFTYTDAIEFLVDSLAARGTDMDLLAIDRILKDAEKNSKSEWDKENTAKIRWNINNAKADRNIV